MEETRVKKYQQYREGGIEETPKEYVPFDNTKDVNEKKDILGTTSTLPINEVLKEASKNSEREKMISKENKKRILKYVLFGVLAVAVVVGLVIFGIYAWR